MRHLLPIIVALLLGLGGCVRHSNSGAEDEVSANCNMATLRQWCQNGCYTINSDLVCVGRVTSSDRAGNFYRTLVVEDETGGVELLLGTYNIASQYPVGLKVALHLKGLAVAAKGEVVQVGLPPQSFDDLPREMESQVVIDSHLVRSNSVEDIEPTECDLSAICASLCGRFVAFGSLSHTPLEGVEESDYYRLVDSGGNAIFLYVSSYSEFANPDIPSSELSVRGILYYEAVGMGIGRHFVVKPRTKDDISTNYSGY